MRGLFALFTVALLGACASGPDLHRAPADEGRDMSDFVVIAHRGASGYLPEHTLEGVAMAHAMGPDFIEQDVVMTRDGELIVLHDLFLDAVTDVRSRFPGRQREDGHFYAIDFSLEEIRSLRVGERRRDNDNAQFGDRFPAAERLFRVPTLEEEIRLIRGLNRSTGRDIGLYVEPKAPSWHLSQGRDLMAAVLVALAEHGLNEARAKVYLQSFDLGELRRAREELGTELKLVQLIGENSWKESPTDFDWLQTEAGLREVAAFADGIGPWLPQVVSYGPTAPGGPRALVRVAHELGLFVHAYTLRADQLPAGVGTLDRAVQLMLRSELDGVFTDQPDQAIAALRAVGARP